jgi:hypothetical protein
MFLVYDSAPSTFTGVFDPLRCDAVEKFMGHYNSSLTLSFFLAHGTMAEKAQASKELAMCDRKMNYWRRQPHYCAERAARAIEKARRSWR